MKAKIITTVTALTLTGVFFTALAFAKSDTPAYSTPAEISPPAAEEPAGSAAAEGFWVCETDGYAAVYHSAEPGKPLEVTDIAISTLRAVDQELFRNGVYFEDYMDVVTFLESFCP